MTQVSFHIAGGLLLTVAEYLTGGQPPVNYVPPTESIIEPDEVVVYPQYNPNNPNTKYSVWTYTLTDGVTYTITATARPQWVIDGIYIVSDTAPYSDVSGVTVTKDTLNAVVMQRESIFGANQYTTSAGYSFLLKNLSFSAVRVSAALLASVGMQKNYLLATQSYAGDPNDLIGTEYAMIGDATSTTTTSTTSTTTLFPITTTTTLPPLPLPPRPFKQSMPVMFASAQLNSIINIGRSDFSADTLPIPFPEELADDLSDFSYPQINEIRLWATNQITMSNYTGKVYAICSESGIETPGNVQCKNVNCSNKVTSDELYTRLVRSELITDGLVTIRVEDLIQLFARVEALENAL
jgi:hypothetical protein